MRPIAHSTPFSSSKLNATAVMVHANTCGVSKYSLERYSSRPIEKAGWQMTSAATPDFHANPSPLDSDAKKYGATDGIRICRQILPARQR